MQKSRLRNFLKVIFIIALFVCISYTNGTNRKVTLIEEILSDLIVAPQKIFVYLKNYIEDDTGYFATVEDLKKENDLLNKQIEDMQNKIMESEIVKAENEVLRKHIKLAELYPDYSLIVADIIVASTNNWEYSYIINRGENQGIKPNMAVIADGGLVRLC